MTIQTLIDGYNLLFTAGFEGRSRQRGWLQRARQRLIQHLESHVPPELHSRTLVVFDVSVDVLKSRDQLLDDIQPSERRSNSQTHSGIQVTFAFDYDEADDMIESLIRKHSAPKNLTVVSSDHRIRKCALARRAISIDSDEYLNQLEKPSAPQDLRSDEEFDRDSEKLSESEVREWLREFGEDTDR